MTERWGRVFFVCIVLSWAALQRCKTNLQNLWREIELLYLFFRLVLFFFSLFLFSFFKSKCVAFLWLRMRWGIIYFIPSVSLTPAAKLSWSCFMLSPKPVPMRSVLPAFWIDYSTHADLLTSWRQQWRAMCAGRSQRRHMGLMCNTKHKYFSAALFSQFLMLG